ncbi:MAG: hypothetical protein RL026_2528 [Pseudomonadota bacterium]|jgi:uncharacterized membrane protein
MDYLALALLHLATVLPALLLGLVLFILRKGSPLHRRLGRLYMALMLFTAAVTLFMPAYVGPRWLGHFGFIHLFSLLTLYSVPSAWWAARRHDVNAHRASMIGLYVGGIVIAGSFALMPGRLLYRWLFSG